MPSNDDGSLTSRLRRAAIALEQRAAAGLASGAIQGTADQLQALSEDEFRGLLATTVQALERLGEAAADGPGPLAELLGNRAAKGAVEGGVAQARRSLPGLEAVLMELSPLIQSAMRHLDEQAQQLSDLREGRVEARRHSTSAMVTGVVHGLQTHEAELQAVAEGSARAAVGGALRAAREELGPLWIRVQRGLALAAGAAALGVAVLFLSKRR
jgi:hypothetical protein